MEQTHPELFHKRAFFFFFFKFSWTIAVSWVNYYHEMNTICIKSLSVDLVSSSSSSSSSLGSFRLQPQQQLWGDLQPVGLLPEWEARQEAASCCGGRDRLLLLHPAGSVFSENRPSSTAFLPTVVIIDLILWDAVSISRTDRKRRKLPPSKKIRCLGKETSRAKSGWREAAWKSKMDGWKVEREKQLIKLSLMHVFECAFSLILYL